MNQSVILMGIKHSGKSSMGRLLSEKWKTAFFDTDAVLEEMKGKSCREIFNEEGEQAFKDSETAACKKIFSENEGNIVVATGGGICNNPDALKILEEHGKFVFLEVEEEVACLRITKKIAFDEEGNITDFSGVPAFIRKHNPKNMDDVKKSFHEFYVARTEIYRKLCKTSVRLDNSSKEDNCRKIMVLLN